MAYWKFTDQYGAAYPGLANSILSVLTFDVAGNSPVSGTTFTGTLDLQETGASMKVLSAMLGMNTIPMTGTVTTTNNELKVDLESTNNAAILTALAAIIPLIGGSIMTAASVTVQNTTLASATVDDDPARDTFNVNTTIKIGSGTGEVVTQVPMSNGIFAMTATFTDFGVSLSDLDFLVPGTDFSTMFPTTLPDTYYNPSTTALNLLSLELGLYVQTTPSLSISVSSVGTSIGIVNIPLFPNALFLNPLAVNISITSPSSNPVAAWGLTGTIALYPYDQQTNPPSANPDFTYELQAQMPTTTDSTFSISGTFDNPDDLPVSQILCDLMSSGSFDTGISDQITLEKFDFETVADSTTGTISEFNVDIAMSSAFGLFLTPGFGVKDFSISVAYTEN